MKRRGFTFIEVMFAVLVLGLGVIMVAAMLPVSARQSRTARETAAGMAAIERGFHEIEALYATGRTIATTTPPGTPNFTTPGFTGNAANDPTVVFASAGSFVGSRDRRYAYLPFFYRSDILGDPQVALVAMRSRNTPEYDDPRRDTAGGPARHFAFTREANLPLEASFTLRVGRRGEDVPELADRILFETGGGAADVRQAAASDAAVVIVLNGSLRIFRLGNAVSDSEYEVSPATPLPARLRGSGTGTDDRTGDGLLIGRQLRNPYVAWNATSNPYVGPSQVIATLDGVALPPPPPVPSFPPPPPPPG